ncbi:MAG: terminase [Herbiconiux sp.]|uniref:hypothetical protein n=1 Tax=Herbiconiux sp. TaxID=1871186 RepID=UPI001211B2F0|nr:hypothetical protein [Herbiconiux sp.]TAJ46348.1 MAG: terminase [Herbiconiux sp.]
MTSTPRLSEFAKAFVFPKTIKKTVWPRVEAKGREVGLLFDWWQAQLGSVCLGYGDDGKYVATVGGIGLSIPRQVGKTYFVLALLFILCILFPGFHVVWTSHHLRTTNKTLTTARGMARRKKIAPHIEAVRTSHGEGQVEFKNGSMIMFGARSQGFGRGFDEIDAEVFDEAQILDTKALEDMIAATNQARHPYGALLFFMGTPPRPSDPSDAFTSRRAKAIEGKASKAIWLEIGADPKSDPNDQSQWPLMNPSYPHRTPPESMERLRENLEDDDSWNREGRGVWDPLNTSRVIDEVTWGKQADPASMAIDRLTLSIEVPPDRSTAAVGLAGLRADGRWHVELDEERHSVDWAIQWVVDRTKKNPLHAVVVDELSGLAEEKRGRHYLIGTKVRVTLAGSEGKDMAIACAKFYDGIYDGSVWHTNQTQVNVALSVATKRPLAGRWAWNRRDPNSNISPIVAETLALWGAQSDNVKRPTVARTETRTAVIL